jgi:hypothetical protein
MPLLQYLSYYQVLEYFFPSYYRSEVLSHIRQEILDPAFNPRDDSHLVRVVNAATAGPKGGANESDQLRATVRGCISESRLEEYLTANRQELTDSARALDLKDVNLHEKAPDIRDQVADRIYEIVVG